MPNVDPNDVPLDLEDLEDLESDFLTVIGWRRRLVLVTSASILTLGVVALPVSLDSDSNWPAIASALAQESSGDDDDDDDDDEDAGR